MATNQPYSTDRTAYEGTAARTSYTYDIDNVVAPTDRVRWATVFAGIFTVIAALTVFAILGVALGLSSFDANNPNSFLAGAGIYGAVTGLIAFALGGFIAAHTAAVSGTGNGVLHGGMVWIVTTVLTVVLLGNGIGTLLNVAGDVATTTANIAAPVAAEVGSNLADDPSAQATVAAGATVAAPVVEGAIQDAQEQLENITPEEVNQATRDLSSAAWGALLVAGLTAAAALVGGVLGTRRFMTQDLTSKRTAA